MEQYDPGSELHEGEGAEHGNRGGGVGLESWTQKDQGLERNKAIQVGKGWDLWGALKMWDLWDSENPSRVEEAMVEIKQRLGK